MWYIQLAPCMSVQQENSCYVARQDDGRTARHGASKYAPRLSLSPNTYLASKNGQRSAPYNISAVSHLLSAKQGPKAAHVGKTDARLSVS